MTESERAAFERVDARTPRDPTVEVNQGEPVRQGCWDCGARLIELRAERDRWKYRCEVAEARLHHGLEGVTPIEGDAAKVERIAHMLERQQLGHHWPDSDHVEISPVEGGAVLNVLIGKAEPVSTKPRVEIGPRLEVED